MPDDSVKKVSSNEKKVWHPVMWPTPTGSAYEHYDILDKPHKRIINNFRRFMKETEKHPEVRQKYIEDMLLSLPSASKTLI